jgi:hypothetical protein
MAIVVRRRVAEAFRGLELRRSCETIEDKRVQAARKGTPMSAHKTFTADEARDAGAAIGIDWSSSTFDVEQFRMGMDVELEHGLDDSATNVTDDDPVVTAKIALAHLNEFPDYYTRLERMESEAEREHGTRS